MPARSAAHRSAAASPLTDDSALAEIRLYGELVVAANDSDGPLTLSELDRVLGIERR